MWTLEGRKEVESKQRRTCSNFRGRREEGQAGEGRSNEAKGRRSELNQRGMKMEVCSTRESVQVVLGRVVASVKAAKTCSALENVS